MRFVATPVALLVALVFTLASCASDDGTVQGAVAEASGTEATTTTAVLTAPTSTVASTTAPSTIATTTTNAPSYCRRGQFIVDEQVGGIVDPDGEWFLPAGVNLIAGRYFDQSFWQNNSSTDLTAEDVAVMRDVWKFNTVRLNLNSVDNPDIWTDDELHRVIGLLTDGGIVAMLENHPYGTGLDPSPEQIAETVEGFAALATRYADNACVWFNPFNEPGGKLPWDGAVGSVYHVNADGGSVRISRAWVDWHVPVIDAIRTVSDNVIVLDDTHFGQGRVGSDYDPDDSAILVYGPELNATYNNLLYSVHFYDRWGGDAADLAQFSADVQAAGLALVVGEIGGHPSLGPGYIRGYWPTTQAFFAAAPDGVGVLLWHGNIAYGTGMSVGAQPEIPGLVAVWDVTTRDATDASGTFLWDWTQNKPAARPGG